MVVVIIGMLVCIALALVVVALVALPAHRDGEVMFVNRRDDSAESTDGADAAGSPVSKDAVGAGSTR